MINYLQKDNKNLVNDYGFKPVVEHKMSKEEAKIKQMPVKQFRCGAVTAVIWRNVIKKDQMEIEVFNTTIERSYKDKLDNWMTTNSYGVIDLNKVRVVCEKAYEYLSLKEIGLIDKESGKERDLDE